MRPIPFDRASDVRLTLDRIDTVTETALAYSADVTVTNLGDFPLRELDPPLALAYHWVNPDTGEVVSEGVRTPLAPEATGRHRMVLYSPAAAGRYRFVPALVQEGVTWLDGNLKDTHELPVFEIGSNPRREPGPQSGPPCCAHNVLDRDSVRQALTFEGKNRPLNIICETVNVCNNRCVICAYGRQTRPWQTMSIETFAKVLDDYSKIGGGHLDLTPVVGDLFLDQRLIERMKLLANTPHIRSVSVTTNAVMARRFNDAELEFIINRFRWLRISVYGIDAAEHATLTGRDTYREMVAQVNRILALAKNEVAIWFRTLRARSKQEARTWVEGLAAFGTTRAARVAIGTPTNTYDNWSVLDTNVPLPWGAQWTRVPDVPGQCIVPAIWGLGIFSNGNVTFCGCSDYDNDSSLHLGNICETSLIDICNSKKLERLWDWQKFGVPSFCRRCSSNTRLDHLGAEITACLLEWIAAVSWRSSGAHTPAMALGS